MINNQFFQNQNENSILTSYNFARFANFVYAEELTFEQYELLKNDDDIIVHNDHRIVYINPNIKLKENDVIFCNSHYVRYLFRDLKSCNLKNLKLITHQSDIPINKNLYSKKPDCISHWYGINIEHRDANLIPIPIGLSNQYSPKNLFFQDFKNKDLAISNKLNKIYVNFNINTNRKVREKLIKSLENKEFFYIERENKDLKDYLDSLVKYKFVLCPEGNGIDTHRFWETIYAGSIPVAKKHITLKTSEGLPVVLIEDFKNLNFEEILNQSPKLTNYVTEKLTIQYWKKLITSEKIHSLETFNYLEKNVRTKVNIFNYKFKIYSYSYYKKFRFYFLKFKKLSKVIKI